jgi:MFS superfamily sulfate permease-like transporter
MNARAWLVIRSVLTAVVIAALAIDAYVHLHLASSYASVRSGVVSEGDLFRIEAALAIVVGAALLVRPRWYTALLALVVSVGGVGAVLLYTYVDVRAVGPLPNMYEPVWFPEKTWSAWGEGIGALAALLLFIGIRVYATHQSMTIETDLPTSPDRPRVSR